MRRNVAAPALAVLATAGIMTLAGGWFSMDSADEFGPHYAGCSAAKSAGVAPLLKGQAGYRADLDPDEDGIACEPSKDWSVAPRSTS